MSGMKRLLDEATPLPWEPAEHRSMQGAYWIRGHAMTAFTYTEADRALIVYAVNRLPDYEAAVEALDMVLSEFDYWTSEPRPAIDGGTVRIHNFREVQPVMERRLSEARAALARLRGES